VATADRNAPQRDNAVPGQGCPTRSPARSPPTDGGRQEQLARDLLLTHAADDVRRQANAYVQPVTATKDTAAGQPAVSRWAAHLDPAARSARRPGRPVQGVHPHRRRTGRHVSGTHVLGAAANLAAKPAARG